MQQLRRSGVSRVRGEKVAAARTENILTHTHTQDDCYTLAANAYARVMKSTKCGPSPHSKNGLVASIVNFQTLMTSDTMKKFAGTIKQKGVAQLLQIEEVRLNYLGQ